MRNYYKRLYSPVQVPSVRAMVAYADPLRTDEERRGRASRVAKQQAKLRRAKIAERWIVFTVASMMAIVMLPVLVVIGAILMARALWRRYTGGRKRQGTSVTTDGTRVPRVCLSVEGRTTLLGPPREILRFSLSARPVQPELSVKGAVDHEVYEVVRQRRRRTH